MKRYIALFIITAMVFSVFGLSSASSKDYYSVTDHKDELRLNDDESDVVNVRTYQGIKTAILTFIKEGREKCYLNVSDYDGNVSDAVSEASLEIIHNTALGAYAVENITHSYAKEFSYYNVEVNIYYKHTKEQVKSIVYLNYVSAVQGALGKAINDHIEYLVISISSELVTPDYVKAYALEYYRNNPLTVLAKPIVKTNVYETQELPKLLEVEIAYLYAPQQETDMRSRLQNNVNTILKNAKNSKDVNTAANACRRLISSSVYLENSNSDAYGTITFGIGNSEGFAMSYKLFCSILGIRCTVVEGLLNGTQHYWDIIEINGEYYHVDPSACDTFGMSKAFLKTDSDFILMNYTWDTSKYKSCNGTLKYEVSDNE